MTISNCLHCGTPAREKGERMTTEQPRYVGDTKRSWGKLMYSFDGSRTWNESRRQALLDAISTGLACPRGSIRNRQEGRSDWFQTQAEYRDSIILRGANLPARS